jgi:hypothetical protein
MEPREKGQTRLENDAGDRSFQVTPTCCGSIHNTLDFVREQSNSASVPCCW